MVEILEDAWLSSEMSRPVFKITVQSGNHDQQPNPKEVVEYLARHAPVGTGAMYYAKVDTGAIDIVRQLTLAGLYVVDVSVTLALDPGRALPVPHSGKIVVGLCQPGQEADVLQIAGSCFRYSRFHLDPQVPPKLAHQIKHNWILNYVHKQRGDSLLVATIADRPVGFLAVLASNTDGARVFTIDLMGVSTAHQSMGVGKALVSFFIDHYGPRADCLQVGTQAANIPSLALYQKCGFSIARTSYVLHKHA